MIETERLILRNWQDRDRLAFAAMCADPRVMATLGPVMSRAESDALVDRLTAAITERGYGFWAIERKEDGATLGFCGIGPAPPETPVAGTKELGWRLAHEHWGQGYAHEAAAATLAWAWPTLPDEEVTAITSLGNRRSWGLMERLGMTRHPDQDFDHPRVPEGSPLRRHLTYRLRRPG